MRVVPCFVVGRGGICDRCTVPRFSCGTDFRVRVVPYGERFSSYRLGWVEYFWFVNFPFAVCGSRCNYFALLVERMTCTNCCSSASGVLVSGSVVPVGGLRPARDT